MTFDDEQIVNKIIDDLGLFFTHSTEDDIKRIAELYHQAKLKLLDIPVVSVPKGTLCNCNSITTDEFRNGVNWRTCNTCGISRIA